MPVYQGMKLGKPILHMGDIYCMFTVFEGFKFDELMALITTRIMTVETTRRLPLRVLCRRPPAFSASDVV